MPLGLSLIHVGANIGYPLLGLLVGVEAMGVPLPGETALIAASLLAAKGTLSIEFVIAIAAVAAIIGDNIGYLIGRQGGLRLLKRPGMGHARRMRLLGRATEIFDRHGGKAVFFGRWITGLRIWASWLAGATRMPWPRFVFFNAAGGISWALSVGLIAYFGGRALADAFAKFGLLAGAVLAVAATALVVLYFRRQGRDLQ